MTHVTIFIYELLYFFAVIISTDAMISLVNNLTASKENVNFSGWYFSMVVILDFRYYASYSAVY